MNAGQLLWRHSQIRCRVRLRAVSTSSARLRDVFMVSQARTPVGSFRGSLAPVPAATLGAVAIKGAIERAGIPLDAVQEVYMGNVISSGWRQAPARQAALGAGLSNSVPCTTINKVCASGMKSIMTAAQSLLCNHQQVMVAGGMESMSNIPFIMHRGELPFGGAMLHDAITYDALSDAFNHCHMGLCGERASEKSGIGRAEQDEYAIASYRRSQAAAKAGLFKAEIVPVTIPQKKGDPKIVEADEEYARVKFDKIATLKAVFKKDGTVTAANASSINDGAAACVLMNTEALSHFGDVRPLARIVAFCDAATEPLDFPFAPVLAVKKLLKMTDRSTADIAAWEFNEAFSVVAQLCIKELGLDHSIVNPHGGAVSIGHPIGMSGTRITNHLALTLKKGELGVAAICNGGGGAGAIMLEKL